MDHSSMPELERRSRPTVGAFQGNANAIATLFIATMLAGMVDAYFVAPEVESSTFDVLASDTRLLIGAFSVMAMAIGIVFIAVAFYPVLRRENETIALTYLTFRAIECVLLLIGPIAYLYLAGLSEDSMNLAGLAERASELKGYGYQIGMVVLGLGSLFLCYALFTSKLLPSFLSAWGGIGYAFLLLSAILDLAGVIDTGGSGALLYIPGGLWEIIILPYWLYRHGFNAAATTPETQPTQNTTEPVR